jgi:hypothetical protein
MNGVVVSLTQPFVDEVAPITDDFGRGGLAVLNYNGPLNKRNGTVALVHRDRPLLESPEIPFEGKAFYATFGLEGMGVGSNGVVTPTTPVELLSRVLTWAYSEPGTAVFTDTTPLTNTTPITQAAITLFTASYTATVPAGYPPAIVQPIAWRWDFGDGSGYVSSATAVAGHTYQCRTGPGEDNVYTVRVEITDGLGNTAIASQEVDVTRSCFQEPVTIQKFFLPFISNLFGR